MLYNIIDYQASLPQAVVQEKVNKSTRPIKYLTEKNHCEYKKIEILKNFFIMLSGGDNFTLLCTRTEPQLNNDEHFRQSVQYAHWPGAGQAEGLAICRPDADLQMQCRLCILLLLL